MPKFTSENAASMGSRGGTATYKKYGSKHMSDIGKVGFQRTADLHYGGDRRLMVNHLIDRGLMATDAVPQNGAFRYGLPLDQIPDRILRGKRV